MKFTVERDRFLPVLVTAATLVPSRHILPVLGHLHITADTEAGLRIRATNMEGEITIGCDADVADEGVMCVPAAHLRALVQTLPEGSQIEIEAETTGRAVMRCGRGRFGLALIPPQDFPILQDASDLVQLEASADAFLTAIGRIDFAISTDEARAYLGGICFAATERAKGRALMLVTTDGYRMAACQLLDTVPAGWPDENPILPRGHLQILRRVLDGAGQVFIALSNRRIEVTADRMTFRGLMLEGIYPDWQRVVPADLTTIVELEGGQLDGALSRANVLLDQTVTTVQGGGKMKARGVDVRLTRTGLHLTGSGSAGQDLAEEVEANCDGEGSFSINVPYMLDAVRAVMGKDTSAVLRIGVVGSSDAGAPLLILPANAHTAREASHFVVQMPMRG